MATGLTEVGDLILEDGTGVLNANTFNLLADMDDYADLRQVGPFVGWRATDESNKVAASIISAQYLCLRWCYRGQISVLDAGGGVPQGLCFPRFLANGTLKDSRGVDVADEVPQLIADAHIEYAARAIDPTTLQAVALYTDADVAEDDGKIVRSISETVGPLSETTVFFGSSTFPTVQKFATLGNADEIIKRSGLIQVGNAAGVIRA